MPPKSAKLSTLGLRHVALYIKNLKACEKFYTEILGMKIDWQPDADNIYLTSGHDNLALHRATHDLDRKNSQLDHIGFILATPEAVNTWYEYMCEQGVTIKKTLKDHRDGTRSFYCADPDGNIIQMIYYPLPSYN